MSPYHKAQHQLRLAMRLDLRYIDQGITFTMVTGLHSAASRSAPQPADYAGWIEPHPLQPHATGQLRPAR